MKTYESHRADVPHRYEVHSDELVYHTGLGAAAKTLRLSWDDIEKLDTDASGALFFIPKKLRPRRQPLAIWLSGNEMQGFLDAAIAEWAKHDRGAAAKAAFDYGADDRSGGWVVFVLSLVFPVFLATMLITDGVHTLRCNRWLETSPKTAQAKLIKITKDRRGNWIWKLEFQTDQGITVQGKRAAYFYDEKGQPTGPIPVAYASEDLSCWDLEIHQTATNQMGVNASNRHFSLLMDLGFGGFFALLGFFTTIWSIGRIRRKRPFKDEVKRAGAALLK